MIFIGVLRDGIRNTQYVDAASQSFNDQSPQRSLALG